MMNLDYFRSVTEMSGCRDIPTPVLFAMHFVSKSIHQYYSKCMSNKTKKAFYDNISGKPKWSI